MANRTFDQYKYSPLKRRVELHADFLVSTVGGIATPVLQKWNYPSLAPAAGTTRTYTTAPTATAPPAGTGVWPAQYNQGSEGVYSVARTAAGLWTVTLQDAYQRLLLIQGHQALAGGAATIVTFAENSTITNMTAGSPGSVIGLALLSATATLADPAAGTSIHLVLMLQDATEP